jgi:MFS family permease
LIKKPVLSKVFFGWWTVISTGIIAFLGVGFTAYGFSVLFKPIANDLGLDRAFTSLATSIQNLGNGVVGPAGGWSSDKYGPKWVIIIGIIMLVIGCILMFFVNSLWSLLIVWGLVIGVGFSLGFTVILDRAIINWFVKKSGIAVNIKFGIQSLSGILMLPVIAWLIDAQGWRWTCVIMGIVTALVCLPLAWFFIKTHRPEHYGLQPDGIKQVVEDTHHEKLTSSVTPVTQGQDFTLRQTSKTLGFWMLIGVVAVSGLGTPIMGLHCVPFLTDRGIDPVQAASMMSIWITCSIPGRLLAGYLIDRLKANHMRWVIVGGYFLQAISVAVYLTTESTPMIYLWFVLYGLGQGISAGAFMPMVASYFGRRSFGSIIGMIMFINLPITLAAPVYVGWVYDTTGTYTFVFTLFMVLMAASGVVAAFILPPRSRVKSPEVSPA